MLDGSIRQIGQPRSFFESPHDLQTARFFNGANFLSGTLHQGRFVTEIGPLQILTHFDRPVTGMIRPNFINIVAGPAANYPNHLTGHILECRYGGELTELRVRIKDTELLVQASPAGRWAVGDQIEISIPPERIWIFPDE